MTIVDLAKVHDAYVTQQPRAVTSPLGRPFTTPLHTAQRAVGGFPTLGERRNHASTPQATPSRH
jgi:hypothetical protein